MKLEIESLDELKALFNFFLYGPEDVLQIATDALDKLAELPPTADSHNSETDESAREQHVADSLADNHKPKRTRRTKEQIAVDNAAEAAVAEANTVAMTVESLAAVATASAEPLSGAASNAGAQADEPKPVASDIAHLHLCRDFIAKHGMPQYEQTFIRAGLANNIMLFTDADRAKHLAVMNQFTAA